MTSTTMASDLAREALDVAALEAAAKASYEYEGDRRGLDYLGWSDEPESVRAQWRDSVRLPIAIYQDRTAYDAIGSGAKAVSWVESASALLELNEKGAVSHPVPGLAVSLLRSAVDLLSTHTAAGAGPVDEALRLADAALIPAPAREGE